MQICCLNQNNVESSNNNSEASYIGFDQIVNVFMDRKDLLIWSYNNNNC